MYSPPRRLPCAWSSVKGRRHPGEYSGRADMFQLSMLGAHKPASVAMFLLLCLNWCTVSHFLLLGTVYLLCQELLHPQQPMAISVSQHPRDWQTWAELVGGWGPRLGTYCAHLGPAPPLPPARAPWPMVGAQLLRTMPPVPGPAWSAPPMAPSLQTLTLPVPWQWLWIVLVLVWSPGKLTVSSPVCGATCLPWNRQAPFVPKEESRLPSNHYPKCHLNN